MRDFHPLSQPCHDNFLSIFKYNIIFALEKRQKAKDKRQKTKVIDFTLYPLDFRLLTLAFRL